MSCWIPITDAQKDGRPYIVGYAGWPCVYRAFCQSFFPASGFKAQWFAFAPDPEAAKELPPSFGRAIEMRDPPTHYLSDGQEIINAIATLDKAFP